MVAQPEPAMVWRVPQFALLKESVRSDEFEALGQMWTMVLYPRGADRDEGYVSLYLELMSQPVTPVETVFKFTLVNQDPLLLPIDMDGAYAFAKSGDDRGFGQFARYSDVVDPSSGFMDDGVIEIAVEVDEQTILDPDSPYDSKDATGYVGLRNQGSTCYLSSLLQSLFHLPLFRQTVLQMPTQTEEVAIDKAGSVPLALQRVFYHLQTSSYSVSTRELTASFGWVDADAFMQHDVQEFSRVLMDNLDEKMKGTAVEGRIAELFEGESMMYIECVHVPYTSSRKEAFQDLSLSVKGAKNIYESLEQYTEEELMEGENKYSAAGHGLQEARKGVKFLSFPPILQLQLMRFEYNFHTDAMVKINDCYQFDTEIDLNRFVEQDPDVPTVDYTYLLHSVLVHAGSVYGGHYYAFVRPEPCSEEGQWYKFDDTVVSQVDASVAVEGNFGGDRTTLKDGTRRAQGPGRMSTSSAYMLVYIRKDMCDRIFENVSIPQHLIDRFRQEEQQRMEKKRAREEEERQCNIRLLFEEQLFQHRGLELGYEAYLQDITVSKESTLTETMVTLRQKDALMSDKYDCFMYTSRQNSTIRPNKRAPMDEPFGMLTRNVFFLRKQLPLEAQDNSLLLIFKFYDPLQSELRYIGSSLFSPLDTLTIVERRFKQLLRDRGFAVPMQMLVFEEEQAYAATINAMEDKSKTMGEYKLLCGDILCFQEDMPSLTANMLIPKLFHRLSKRVQVRCMPIQPTGPSEGILLTALIDFGYMELSETLADRIQGVAPRQIRFFTARSDRAYAMRHDSDWTLLDYIHHFDGSRQFQASRATYEALIQFDVMPYDIDLFENYIHAPVSIYDGPSAATSTPCTILVPQTGTVADILAHVSRDRQVPLHALRVVIVHDSRVVQILDADDALEDLYRDPYGQTYNFPHTMSPVAQWRCGDLRIDIVPAAEQQRLPQDKIVWTSFYFQEGSFTRFYGEPFSVLLQPGCNVSECRDAIAARVSPRFSREQVETWKLAYVRRNQVEELEGTCVYNCDWDDTEVCLGIDQGPDRPVRRQSIVSDKAIKIYT